MAVDMTPQPGDYSINLPITFDYKGGRGQEKKGKIILSIIDVVLTVMISVACATNVNLDTYLRVCIPIGVCYIGLFIIRYFVFRELWFSDIYETLKATDYELKLDSIWQIFDIDFNYPYICYFKNGYKGIFVRMEKDAITGKPEENMYDHYEAIGDAYNIAHSLNMNIVHLDYMDNVGNDSRMQKMYDDLAFVENPDMQEMLIDIYSNLQDEMSMNYASFDIYLFMTKDNISNFVYNMQAVCNRMIGGNFITYKVLDRYEIAKVCVALFNLHDFSIVDACENVLQGVNHHGIIPISLTHGDGTVEEFNKTIAEKKVIDEENKRHNMEAAAEAERNKAEAKRKRHEARRNKGKVIEEEKKIDNTEVDLFGEPVIEKPTLSKKSDVTLNKDVTKKKPDLKKQADENNDNIDLF